LRNNPRKPGLFGLNSLGGKYEETIGYSCSTRNNVNNGIC
jgi:hypothetical protein